MDTRAKILAIGGFSCPCALGKNGSIAFEKGREGDSKTPLGKYAIRFGFYRSDRITLPKTALHFWPTRQDDGWCDAPEDAAYNRFVKLPYPASAEQLWRDSYVYDVIIVLGHNDSPPTPGLGSAIFLHIARNGYQPTEGCVAVGRQDMLALLPLLNGKDEIEIF